VPYSPGNPATLSTSSGLRSAALRPTLSGGLPFSGFDENPYLINMFVEVLGIILSREYYRIYPEILEGKEKEI
jgi:hypothetical protein